MGSLEPGYFPKEFDLLENDNIVVASEIHAFEQVSGRERYCREVGQQLQNYAEGYNAEEIWILGDTGSLDDVYHVLEPLDSEKSVKLVAGDEDRDRKRVNGNNFTGWWRQKYSEDILDVEAEYELINEGFNTEVNGLNVHAAHHPRSQDRPKGSQIPEFTVERDLNKNTIKKLPPSLKDIDVAVYDHVHMPYSRHITGQYEEGLENQMKILVGIGGRRNDYHIKADCMPESSLHLLSFGDDLTHTLQFDADHDGIFEHLIFDHENHQRYFRETLRSDENPVSGYLPIQSRFHRSQIRDESWEDEEDFAMDWSQR